MRRATTNGNLIGVGIDSCPAKQSQIRHHRLFDTNTRATQDEVDSVALCYRRSLEIATPIHSRRPLSPMALALAASVTSFAAGTRRDVRRIPSALQTLNALGVAFVAFGPDLRVRTASEAAISTLGPPAGDHADSLWRRLIEVIVAVVESPDGRHTQSWLIPLTEHCVANIRRDVEGAGAGAIVAILQPRCLTSRQPDLTSYGLTGRETDVARLVAAGHATKEIAAMLQISFHTARHHKERVFAKLGARCRVSVARIVLAREGA
jgi:DNA-binding CsgD family transcriptional regulator